MALTTRRELGIEMVRNRPKLDRTTLAYQASPRLQEDARRHYTARDKEKVNLVRRFVRLIEPITEGTDSDLGTVGNKLRELETRLSDISVSNEEEPEIIEWHLNLTEIYKHKIAKLSDAL